MQQRNGQGEIGQPSYKKGIEVIAQEYRDGVQSREKGNEAQLYIKMDPSWDISARTVHPGTCVWGGSVPGWEVSPGTGRFVPERGVLHRTGGTSQHALSVPARGVCPVTGGPQRWGAETLIGLTI